MGDSKESSFFWKIGSVAIDPGHGEEKIVILIYVFFFQLFGCHLYADKHLGYGTTSNKDGFG